MVVSIIVSLIAAMPDIKTASHQKQTRGALNLGDD
jgi:hypothetical protein